MAFKDILLTLTSYPDPTPASVADDAVAIAATFGAHLAAVACEVHVEVPGHFLSGSMANIPGIIAGETEKSRNSAKAMLAAFDNAASKGRYSARNPAGKMPDLRCAGSPGRACAAPRSHHRAGAGQLRPVVCRSRHLRIGTADPHPARKAARTPVPTRHRRRRLGFQSRRGPRGFRRHAAARKGRKVHVVTVINEKMLEAGTPPKSWPGTWRATASTWCWTRSMPTAEGSARCSRPTPRRNRSTFS